MTDGEQRSREREMRHLGLIRESLEAIGAFLRENDIPAAKQIVGNCCDLFRYWTEELNREIR